MIRWVVLISLITVPYTSSLHAEGLCSELSICRRIQGELELDKVTKSDLLGHIDNLSRRLMLNESEVSVQTLTDLHWLILWIAEVDEAVSKGPISLGLEMHRMSSAFALFKVAHAYHHQPEFKQQLDTLFQFIPEEHRPRYLSLIESLKQATEPAETVFLAAAKRVLTERAGSMTAHLQLANYHYLQQKFSEAGKAFWEVFKAEPSATTLQLCYLSLLQSATDEAKALAKGVEAKWPGGRNLLAITQSEHWQVKDAIDDDWRFALLLRDAFAKDGLKLQALQTLIQHHKVTAQQERFAQVVTAYLADDLFALDKLRNREMNALKDLEKQQLAQLLAYVYSRMGHSQTYFAWLKAHDHGVFDSLFGLISLELVADHRKEALQLSQSLQFKDENYLKPIAEHVASRKRYAWTSKRVQSVLKTMDEVAILQRDGQFYFNYAYLKMTSGDVAAAITALKKAALLHPNRDLSRFAKAQVLAISGDDQGAYRVLSDSVAQVSDVRLRFLYEKWASLTASKLGLTDIAKQHVANMLSLWKAAKIRREHQKSEPTYLFVHRSYLYLESSQADLSMTANSQPIIHVGIDSDLILLIDVPHDKKALEKL